jgi:hypothetical protein
MSRGENHDGGGGTVAMQSNRDEGEGEGERVGEKRVRG